MAPVTGHGAPDAKIQKMRGSKGRWRNETRVAGRKAGRETTVKIGMRRGMGKEEKEVKVIGETIVGGIRLPGRKRGLSTNSKSRAHVCDTLFAKNGARWER